MCEEYHYWLHNLQLFSVFIKIKGVWAAQLYQMNIISLCVCNNYITINVTTIINNYYIVVYFDYYCFLKKTTLSKKLTTDWSSLNFNFIKGWWLLNLCKDFEIF